MRKFIGVLIGAALLASAPPSMAHGGYRSFHGGYGHYHGHHGDAGAWLVGGLIGGLIIGDWLSRPRYGYGYGYYYPPQPAGVVYQPAAPAFTHCLPTTGEGWVNGRRALYSGTMCYDVYGRSYILNNSVRFRGYLR